MKEYIRNNFKVISMLVIIILIAAIGVTFAFTMESINVSISTGKYGVVYSGSQTLDVSGIKLQPVLDSNITDSSNSSKVLKINFGVKGASSNPTDVPIIYDVSLTELDIPEELRNRYFKWRLYKNGSVLSEGSFSYDFDAIVDNRMVLTNIQQDLPSYNANADSYTFYIWISETCSGSIETCNEFSDQSDMLNKTFSGNIRIELSTKGKKELVRTTNGSYATLLELDLVDSLKTDTPNFDRTSCSSGCNDSKVGIYSSVDDLGTSYYFRGSAENNYVYFAGFYWRIIRINGDGTIRMIYDGTVGHENGESSDDRYLTSAAFNNSENSNGNVGYMYGRNQGVSYELEHANELDSTIKNYIENTWYASNLKGTSYERYIADAIYCNDREVSSGSGIGTNQTYYKAYERLRQNKNPTLLCDNVRDKFTVSEELGNGKLKYPIGLITADELVFAGGRYSTTNRYSYLYVGETWFWTMTPFYYDGQYGYIYDSNRSGAIDYHRVSYGFNIRPVISLKANSINNGSGLINDPFSIIQ